MPLHQFTRSHATCLDPTTNPSCLEHIPLPRPAPPANNRYVLPRLALVGDAAHAVHPMAGQGVNLGFGDAAVLAEALAGAVEAGGDLGDGRLLAQAYEGPRRRAVMTMVTALDGIKKAFQVRTERVGLRRLRWHEGTACLRACGSTPLPTTATHTHGFANPNVVAACCLPFPVHSCRRPLWRRCAVWVWS